MRINKTKKKGVMGFTHRGNHATFNFEAKVNDEQKSFIERNAKNIYFDINDMKFYLYNYTTGNSKKKNTFKKITLPRAMYFEQNGKLPQKRLQSLPIINFRPVN